MSQVLAPCVAVVGPANSGKTTLLHLLDRALQGHPSRPLVYVVKGNPDGTGRYLFHAPELRDSLKQRVKGAWCDTTVGTVRGWIEECRRHLDLVLVDLGGRHAPGNDLIRCSGGGRTSGQPVGWRRRLRIDLPHAPLPRRPVPLPPAAAPGRTGA